MNQIREVQRLNDLELQNATPDSASWHQDYRDTAYIYIGGLPYELSEGDIVTIFSQFGEPSHVKLIRDKETGKSKGFCFLKYEDQRSTNLAVDNMTGTELLGRIIRVDHTRYKKKDDEEEEDGLGLAEPKQEVVKREERVESEERKPMLKEERELQELIANHDDEDPMKPYLIEQKKKEVDKARERWERKHRKEKREGRDRKDRHRDSGRHRNGDRDEDSNRHGPRDKDRHGDSHRDRDSGRRERRSSRDRSKEREKTRDRSKDRDDHRRRNHSRERASRRDKDVKKKDEPRRERRRSRERSTERSDRSERSRERKRRRSRTPTDRGRTSQRD